MKTTETTKKAEINENLTSNDIIYYPSVDWDTINAKVEGVTEEFRNELDQRFVKINELIERSAERFLSRCTAERKRELREIRKAERAEGAEERKEAKRLRMEAQIAKLQEKLAALEA